MLTKETPSVVVVDQQNCIVLSGAYSAKRLSFEEVLAIVHWGQNHKAYLEYKVNNYSDCMECGKYHRIGEACPDDNFSQWRTQHE